MCEKFQMIPIPYDDFLDEDSWYTENALESHISEILEILHKDYHDWWLLQIKFFQIRILSRSFVESFKRFLQIFKTFRNWSREKKLFYLETTGQL